MSDFKTYTLEDYTVPDPDGCKDVVLTRPLTVTVGTQALEGGVADGKTLLRFALRGGNPLVGNRAKMRVRVFPKENSPDGTRLPVSFDEPLFVELLFDNTSFVTERKEMPFWLIDTLEFATKTLRAQYELNQLVPDTESLD